MTEIFDKAYAKLNISLDITARRNDGYHEMAMVMQAISLGDDVYIELNDSGRQTAVTDLYFIPGDERNLAVKAAKLYLAAIDKEEQGVKIRIDKHTPVGAGMGGGSADAAAVLRGMNKLFDNALGRDKLLELAACAGSDVPFCLLGGTMLAKGRGEVLSPLPNMPECTFAICKPEFSISTPEFFKKFDQMTHQRHPDTAGMIAALEAGSLTQVCRRMYNVLEDIDDRRLRTVGAIKSELLDFGALGAMMTGTGSAVFGVFTDETAAEKAAAALKKEYGFGCTAKPVGEIM